VSTIVPARSYRQTENRTPVISSNSRNFYKAVCLIIHSVHHIMTRQEYPVILFPEEIQNIKDNWKLILNRKLVGEKPLPPREVSDPGKFMDYSEYFRQSIVHAMVISAVLYFLLISLIFSYLWLLFVIPILSFLFIAFYSYKDFSESHKINKAIYYKYIDDMADYKTKLREYEVKLAKSGIEKIDYNVMNQKRLELMRTCVNDNSIVELMDFDNPKKGVAENFFYNYLIKWFGEAIHTDKVIDVFLGDGVSSNKAYVPDYWFIHPKNGLKIDIEIDEPYYRMQSNLISVFVKKFGTIAPDIYIKPIHYNGSDDKRNEYFIENNCIVIRFSEEQIIRSPDSCCKIIAELIYVLTGDLYGEQFIFETKDIINIKQWSYTDALEMAQNNYRENYLKLLQIPMTMNKYYGKIHPVQVKESDSGEMVDFLHPELNMFPLYEGTLSVCLQQEIIIYGTSSATDYTETRSMLFRVPAEVPDNNGVMHPIQFKDVEMILETIPNCRIVKTLSSEPIITEALAYSISQGNNTLEAIAEKQVARDEEGNVAISKKTGKPVYRILEFSIDFNTKDDIDHQEIGEQEIKLSMTNNELQTWANQVYENFFKG